MNWLKKVGSFFANLFSSRTAQAIERGIEVTAPYVSMALTIAKNIAALTPNRTDDEILALIEHYGVPIVWNPAGNRGTVLRDVAVSVLKKQFPQAETATLNRAVEIAVGAIRP